MGPAQVIRTAVLSAGLVTLAGCVANPALTAAPSVAPSAQATPTPTVSGTPPPTQSPASATAVALEPPDARIAFVKRDYDEATDAFDVDIYTVNPAEPGLTRLTNDAREEHGLVWAPDGRRLYYESERQVACGVTYCFPNRLFSVRWDGSDVRDLGRIAPGPFAYEASGQISPNNLFVAYAGDGAPGGIPIVILDLQHGVVRRLGEGSREVRWSPNSNLLLLLDVARGVAVIDPATDHTVRRVDDRGVRDILGWTPDGRSILYQSCGADLPKDQVITCLEGPPWALDIEDPNSRRARYEGPISPPFLAASPDGLWVANVEPDGLYVGPSDGERQLVLAAQVGADYAEYPAWSPGADWIAFRGPDAILVVPRAGGEALSLPPGYFAAWQPPVID